MRNAHFSINILLLYKRSTLETLYHGDIFTNITRDTILVDVIFI